MQTNPDQKRDVSLSEVINNIDIGAVQDVPRVILSVSPCRSATTAFLRVFGAVGIESHYQELKNVLRWLVQNKDFRWQLPRRPNGIIYLKETVGPFTIAEVSFNPLEVLLGAGFPPDKLQIIISGRAPLSTWDSWDQWDGRWTTVDRFIQAYRTVERIRQQVMRLELPMTTFVYEAIRDNDAEMVVEKLFERLAIPYSPRAVRGWSELPPLGTSASNAVFPDEPPTFVVPGVHDRIKSSDGFTYFSRANRIANLAPEEVKQIAAAGLPGIYDLWRRACEDDFGVNIAVDRDWEIWNNHHK